MGKTLYRHSTHPGEYLRDELAERNWTQKEFASILGRPVQAVNEILTKKKRITADTAKAIALALGTSAEFWMNLQAAYDLATAPEADVAISKRAKAASKVA